MNELELNQSSSDWRQRLGQLMDGAAVQRLVTLLIIVNAVILGLQTSPAIMADWGRPLLTLDAIILACFVIELALRFAARGPRVGIYNIAYDIWLNGVPGNREIMIWTENYRQVPAGRVVARGLKFNNRTWRVFATSDNHIITFLPDRRIESGDMRIKARLNWLRNRGMIPARSTLGQICFGVEIVSTGGEPARFKFDNFDVRVTRR